VIAPLPAVIAPHSLTVVPTESTVGEAVNTAGREEPGGMGGMAWVVPVRYIGEPNGLAICGHAVPLAKKLRETLSPCDGVAQVRVMVPSPLLTIDPVAAAFAGVAANNTTAETKNALATTMRVVRVNRDIGTPLGIGPNPLPDRSKDYKN